MNLKKTAKQSAKKGAKGWIGLKVAKKAVPTRNKKSKKPLFGALGAGAVVAGLLAKFGRKGRVKGAANAVTSTVTKDREYDDVTLARKVESEIFRPADAPKGDVSVSVADGVVELRGELDDQDQVEKLGKAAKGVEGVKDVRNLLSVA